jgi:hypothetical protein
MFNTLTSCEAMFFFQIQYIVYKSLISVQYTRHFVVLNVDMCLSSWKKESSLCFSVYFSVQSSTSRAMSFNLSINLTLHVHHVILLLTAMNVLKHIHQHVDLFLGLLMCVIKKLY